jgi:hypothetical protein
MVWPCLTRFAAWVSSCSWLTMPFSMLASTSVVWSETNISLT